MRKIYTFLLLGLPMLIAPKAILAQADVDKYYGVNDLIEQGVNLGQRDLRSAIAGIINLILGFLGVIAVIIVLFGGFQWMTSAGDSGKIDSAKQIIIAGVVGLAIVLAAFAISSFVLNELYNATRS